jgi:hypothetical protein
MTRRPSGKCSTCSISFKSGEAVYAYKVMDANGNVTCDGGGCYYPNVWFDGSLVDGVVNPSVSEIAQDVHVINNPNQPNDP